MEKCRRKIRNDVIVKLNVRDKNLHFCPSPKCFGMYNGPPLLSHQYRLANVCDCLYHMMACRCLLDHSCKTRSWVLGSTVIRTLICSERSYF